MRHAPRRRVRRRGALAVQAGQRRRQVRARTTWAGCASCSSGSARPRTRTTSSTRCATTSARPRCSSSRPRATSSRCPAASTPVDFAYAVHTEVGHRCVGARVNGKLVPLESSLTSGDVVEVFTSKAENAGPNRDWLQFVKSPRARSKIKAWFSKERREEAVENGKESIARAMRKAGPAAAPAALRRGARRAARRAALPGRHGAVRRRRRGPDLGDHRGAAARAGARGQRTAPTEDLAEAVTPTRDRDGQGAPAGRPRHRGRRRRRRLGEARPLLHARCPATTCSGSSPAGTASPCTAPTASTSRRCAQEPDRIVPVDLGAQGDERLPGQHPGGGARPRAAALRRHPRAVRPARQHPVGVGEHHPRPHRALALHLRDGRRHATSEQCSRPCATSTASTTSIASDRRSKLLAALVASRPPPLRALGRRRSSGVWPSRWAAPPCRAAEDPARSSPGPSPPSAPSASA